MQLFHCENFELLKNYKCINDYVTLSLLKKIVYFCKLIKNVVTIKLFFFLIQDKRSFFILPLTE